MSDKKVYVHYEPLGGEAHTQSIPVEDTTTALDVIKAFVLTCKSINLELDLQCASARDENGSLLSPGVHVLSAVGNRSDIFITFTRDNPPAVTSAKAIESISASKPAAGAHLSGAPDVTMDQVVSAAEHLFVERNFKKLLELISDPIRKRVGGKAEFSLQALLCRARLNNAQFSEALAAADRLTQLEESSYLAHYLSGRCQLGLADHEEALVEMQRALSLFGGASRSATRVSADQDKHGVLEIDIRAAEAEALYELGRHVEAADKLNAVMNSPTMKADDHLSTLHVYAKICIAYAKWSDCMRSLLRAIAANQNDKTSKRLLVEAMKVSPAFDEMLQQIPSGPQAAAVYAFLGVIARDESAFGVAAKLLSLATAAQPDNANFALTHIHIHESNNDSNSALEVMKRYLVANRKIRVTYGEGELREGFSCGDLADVVDMALNSGLGAIASSDIIQWVEENVPRSIPGSTAAELDKNCGYAQVLSADGSEGTHNFAPTVGGNAASIDMALDILAIAFTAVKILYSRGQLAYLPQIIKIVEPTRRDYQMALKVSVHETAVRNEHAYYLCIVQACAVHCARQLQVDEAVCSVESEEPLLVDRWLRNRPEGMSAAASNVIYVVGDSHCMPPAWSTISSHRNSKEGDNIAKLYTLVPKLVTGLKHWHLRQDSRFYPKATFWSAMSSIQDGAKVIFMLGEIDCREGLLRAVEKAAYPNLDSAMKHTSNIFASTIKSIISGKPNLKIFIHPIVPVLDPTRKIVVKYNTILRAALSSIRGVTWIDIFDSMLYDPIKEANRTGVNIIGGGGVETLKLRESYVFDGTHMHPNYVPLILGPFMHDKLD